jgi:hypothetical protein
LRAATAATSCDAAAAGAAHGHRPLDRDHRMRFVVTLFVALIVLTALQPWLQKLGIGRLPGDINFRLGKREISLPFASTLLLTFLVFLAGKLL